MFSFFAKHIFEKFSDMGPFLEVLRGFEKASKRSRRSFKGALKPTFKGFEGSFEGDVGGASERCFKWAPREA